MGGRVCAGEVPARTSTPTNNPRILVKRRNFVMKSSSVKSNGCRVACRSIAPGYAIASDAVGFTPFRPLKLVVRPIVSFGANPARRPRAQVPDIVSANNADCPDVHRECRDGTHERK